MHRSHSIGLLFPMDSPGSLLSCQRAPRRLILSDWAQFRSNVIQLRQKEALSEAINMIKERRWVDQAQVRSRSKIRSNRDKARRRRRRGDARRWPRSPLWLSLTNLSLVLLERRHHRPVLSASMTICRMLAIAMETSDSD